jgi:hypothetical protein
MRLESELVPRLPMDALADSQLDGYLFARLLSGVRPFSQADNDEARDILDYIKCTPGIKPKYYGIHLVVVGDVFFYMCKTNHINEGPSMRVVLGILCLLIAATPALAAWGPGAAARPLLGWACRRWWSWAQLLGTHLLKRKSK